MQFTERALNFLSVNQRALRFLALFAVIFGVSYFVFGIAPGVRNHIIKPYTEWLAVAVAFRAGVWNIGPSFTKTFDKVPVVHHGPYEYSSPLVEEDWLAQTRWVEGAEEFAAAQKH